jgi:hypothetical protein
MLGGFGRSLTQAMIDRRVKELKCPHTIRNLSTIQQGLGKACFDCVGLIKGYLWEQKPGVVSYNIPKGSDQNVGMMYRSCKVKGDFKDMPDTPGLLVFTKDLGHLGIYIGKDSKGNREYIESTPARNQWGVTKSNDQLRTWAYWGEYSFIDYVSKKMPTPLNPGDIVYVSGVGRSSSLGTGRSTANYRNKRMVIIKHLPKSPYPYGCSTMIYSPVGEEGSRYITAYFKEESLKKNRL